MASTLPGTAAGGRTVPPDTTNAGGTGGGAEVKSGPSPVLRAVLIGVGIIVLLVAIVYGVKYIAYATTHETTDDASIDADVVQITSKIAERVNHIYVDTNQTVKKGQLVLTLDDANERDAYNQAAAAVSAQQAQALAAEENVALTRATQTAQNLQNKGSVAQALAGISNASAQAESEDQQIAASSAAVDSARAQLKAAQDGVPGAHENLVKASADLARTQSLVSTGDESRSQLDAARATYEAARSQFSQAVADAGAAQAALDEAVQKLNAQRYTTVGTQSLVGVQQGQLTTAQGHLAESSAPERVSAEEAQAQAARAQVASLHAQLATAADNLSYTRIISPINGYVGQKNVEIGQTVAPGESLVTLIPSSNAYITANFKETQVGRMRVGQPVDISVDAYKGVAFVGHVENLSPASQNTFSLVPAQNATGNFVKVTQRLPVRILFDRVENGNLSDYALRPGMSVEASVKVK
jgi:membrane fusion protein (multidrug efflux system)